MPRVAANSASAPQDILVNLQTLPSAWGPGPAVDDDADDFSDDSAEKVALNR